MPIYPSTRQLEMICMVGRTRSFVRAAEALGISQPALSQAVAQTERLLGAQLFRRSKRSVAVTPSGQRFLSQTENMLSGLDRSMNELRYHSDAARGRVDIACLGSISCRILPVIVQSFRQRYPEAVVRIRDDDPDGIVDRVRLGTVDMALSALFEPESGIIFTPVIEDDMRLICRHDHPLAQHPEVRWEDLLCCDVVAMAQGTGIRTLIDRQLPDLQIFKDATFEIARIPSVLDVVEQSGCAGVVPALMMAAPGIDQRFHHVALQNPRITRTIGFIMARDRPLSATAEAFRVHVHSKIASTEARKFPFVRFHLDMPAAGGKIRLAES